MAETNPANQFNLNRRQLLAAACAASTAEIVLVVDRVEDAHSAGMLQVPEVSVPPSDMQTWTVCATTARRLQEITRRNRFRKDVGLPLLSITKELRRMKAAADAEEFGRFEAVHAKAAWDEVLRPARAARGNPNWRPKSWADGMVLQNKVREILRERFQMAPRAENHAASTMERVDIS